MTGRLTGKTAFITAAAQGIGRATALAFAREGAKVIASDIDSARLAAIADKRIAVRLLDVTDAESIRHAADEIGVVDVLFNCAGYVPDGTVLECDEELWRRAWDLNVTSMYRLIRAFLPGMRAAGRGSIINMSSIVSSIKAVPDRFAYGTTKAAVIGLTKSIARDFVGDGIRCNAICPGTVHTPSWEARVAATPDPQKARADFIARQPMGRLGTAEEIAALAIYLASDESAYTTGTTLSADGGMAL